MRRYRGLFRPLGAFTRAQFSADYTISMFGFNLRQGQGLAGGFYGQRPAGTRLDHGKLLFRGASRFDYFAVRSQVILDNLFGLGVRIGDIIRKNIGLVLLGGGLRQRGIRRLSRVTDVAGDLGGQPWADRVLQDLVLPQGDTHGYALDDMNEIAGRVVRRQ